MSKIAKAMLPNLKRHWRNLAVFFKRHWKGLSTVGILTILASIAEFSGYSLRDFFEKKPPAATQFDTLNKLAPTIQQTTHGNQSPAVKTENGDVHINYGDGDWEKDAEKTKKDTLK